MSLPAGLTFAVVSVAIALALRGELSGILPPGFPFLTFFPAVILTAFICGLWPAVLSAVLSGLCALYFFIPPFNSFAIDGASGLALGFYVFIVSVDIAVIEAMRRANDHLEQERRRSALLAEQQALLYRELQHRVSNNLQLVGSLLTLQAAQVADPSARRSLDAASARLTMLGRIHRRLHDPSGSSVPFDRFLGDLLGDVVSAGGNDRVRMDVRAVAADLPVERAIPLAMAVVELTSNSLEHGFADGRHGHIAVQVTASVGETHLNIAVVDDGMGLPDGFDLDTTDSLGLRVVASLASQLDGDFAISPGRDGIGTSARLTVPLS